MRVEVIAAGKILRLHVGVKIPLVIIGERSATSAMWRAMPVGLLLINQPLNEPSTTKLFFPRDAPNFVGVMAISIHTPKLSFLRKMILSLGALGLLTDPECRESLT